MDNTQDILESCNARAQKAFPAKGGTVSARDAAYYLAHTEKGESIRQLAKASGRHPSTVLRAVRRVEQHRDDPLLDHALTRVEEGLETKAMPAPANDNKVPRGHADVMDAETLRREAKKFLRRLSEPGAFLLIARHASRAGIFCAANDHQRPIATLPVDTAAEFLRQDWIKVQGQGSATVRYKITEVGRSYLRRALAEEQLGRRAAEGFAEAPTPFQGQHQERGERSFIDPLTGKTETVAINLGESPIGWLTRRRGPDGKPFLDPVEVEAGEKLRNDFETAQIGPQVAQNWEKFLTPGDRFSGSPVPGGPCSGSTEARERVIKALSALGPGLADVAVRTCCFLEGLEACERRMGWSARSGKVVLKLALQRLADHYGMIVFRD